jgi:hypothetical protein
MRRKIFKQARRGEQGMGLADVVVEKSGPEKLSMPHKGSQGKFNDCLELGRRRRETQLQRIGHNIRL